MTNRIKVGDRVLVIAGQFKGKAGKIDIRRSVYWVVAFDGGGSAQLASSQLRKIEVAS